MTWHHDPTLSELQVPESLTCVGCGYNLKTLPLSHRCPECGRPVIETLYPFADDVDLLSVYRLRKLASILFWLPIAAVIINLIFGALALTTSWTHLTKPLMVMDFVLTAVYLIVSKWFVSTACRAGGNSDGCFGCLSVMGFILLLLSSALITNLGAIVLYGAASAIVGLLVCTTEQARRVAVAAEQSDVIRSARFGVGVGIAWIGLQMALILSLIILWASIGINTDLMILFTGSVAYVVPITAIATTGVVNLFVMYRLRDWLYRAGPAMEFIMRLEVEAEEEQQNEKT